MTLQVPFTEDPGSQPALEFYPVRDPDTKAFTAVAATLGFHSETEIPLGERYRLAAKVSANLAGGLGVRLSNDGQFQLSSGLCQEARRRSPMPCRSGRAFRSSRSTTTRRYRWCNSGRLEDRASRSDRVRSRSESSGRTPSTCFSKANLKDGLIELRTEEADSFIATLLPKGGISSSFSLGLGFSNRTGFYFKGSASLSIRAPVHVSLGPVDVKYLGFAVSAIDDHLVLDVTAGLGAKFGPLSVTVDEVGLRAKLATQGRSLGQSRSARPRVRLQAAERRRARDRRRRGQGRRLSLLRSRPRRICRRARADPGGLPEPQGNRTDHHADARRQQGLLAAHHHHRRVQPGMQLGWGFTLIGVGGLLGLNRTVDLAGARARASAPALRAASCFPVDPVANASRMISDLRAIFPPAPGRFLIGPMRSSDGARRRSSSSTSDVIIEMPGNYRHPRRAAAILVSDDEGLSILRLQVQFHRRASSSTRSRGWFFAALFDSRA